MGFCFVLLRSHHFHQILPNFTTGSEGGRFTVRERRSYVTTFRILSRRSSGICAVSSSLQLKCSDSGCVHSSSLTCLKNKINITMLYLHQFEYQFTHSHRSSSFTANCRVYKHTEARQRTDVRTPARGKGGSAGYSIGVEPPNSHRRPAPGFGIPVKLAYFRK